MEFRVLGPLEIHDRGQELALGPPRIREVCAILLVRPGHLVSVNQFIDELWPDQPPGNARALVRGYLSRLRRVLRAGPSGPAAAGRLVTRKPGYLLHVGDETDLHRFTQLVADARTAVAAGQPQQAVDRYRRAHQLWRGEPFADVPPTPTISAAALWLTEQRMATLEDLFDAALAAGHHSGIVTELTAHVTGHPLRERPSGQLMLALYRSGRQADALQQYQRTRHLLAEEIGGDPGPDLQTVHQQILTSDPALIAAATARPVPDIVPGPAMPVPRQLPARPALFAGRDRELARLAEILDVRGMVVISAIAGAGGVGKTWLALRWAHDNLDRFPDGQLQINLRGFDPSGQPVAPQAAVRTFLDALGVPPAAIPAGLDAQVGLYRSLLAGKRMLILLDNARDADQVRPLLPGSAECVVIVTSRHRLTGLVATDGAHPLALDLLTATDAHRLLANRLGEDRLAAEPDATTDIIARCARLALALALVAGRAATQPSLPLSALADELRDRHNRLDALTGDCPATDVRAVFSWSYHTLTPDTARLFRLLGLHPGPDISVPAAASLAGITARRAGHLLAELTRVHLTAEHTPGRYTLHDLLRAYATEQTSAVESAEQRRAAIGRTLDHYLHTAHSARLLLGPRRDPITLAPPRPDVTPEQLTDRGQALDWFTREHRVLVAAVHAAGAGFERHTWHLADTLGAFFNRRGHWHDWHTTTQAALHAAQRLHDQRAQAHAHCWLAEVYAWIGRHDDTSTHLDHARRLYDRLGDTAGLAYVHLCRGWVCEPEHRYREALDHSEQALHLYQAAGHQRGQADALNNVGWYHAQLGNYEQAIAYCGKALTRQQQLGNRAWEARTWDSLGYAHHHLSHHEQATTCYRRALDLFRDLGNRYYEARVLTRLGDTHHAVGNLHAARHTWQHAWDILHELSHPDAHNICTRLNGPSSPR